MDGYLPLEKISPVLPALRFPPAEQRDYATLGDFVAARLGRAPREGETFDEQGFRFEALDLDGARVDKVLITTQDSGSPLLIPGAHRPHTDKNS